MKTMLKSILSVFAISAALMSSHVMAQDYFPILQYHHVSETTPFSTSVTPKQLQEHMDYLESAGFNVIDLTEGLEKIKKGIELPNKSVAITFDDAYLNIYENGFPIIKSKGFPFTVFINTQPIAWKSKKFLTWDHMREMQQHNVVFANHTISHPYMPRLEEGESKSAWRERMLHEVNEVERLLIKELGTSPKMIAYPYGESNTAIRNQIKELGLIGFGQQSGVVSIDSDFTNLPRYPASGHYAKLSALKTKLASLPMPLNKIVNGGDFADENPVMMELTFKEGKYRFRDLACYVSGQKQAKLEWITKKTVKVIAEQKFKYGRGRINCTMPSMKSGQFHWFSNVWIRPKASQRYIQ